MLGLLKSSYSVIQNYSGSKVLNLLDRKNVIHSIPTKVSDEFFEL